MFFTTTHYIDDCIKQLSYYYYMTEWLHMYSLYDDFLNYLIYHLKTKKNPSTAFKLDETIYGDTDGGLAGVIGGSAGVGGIVGGTRCAVNQIK